MSVFYFTFDSYAGSTKVYLTDHEQVIKVGQSLSLKIEGIKGKAVKWKSSRPKIASVSKNGIVRGLKKGQAIIKGYYKDIVFSTKVTVNPKSKKIHYCEKTVFKVYNPKITEEDGALVLYLGGKFTNKSSTPTSCYSHYFFKVFVNDIEYKNYSIWNSEELKNGASLAFYQRYDGISKGDKVEVYLYQHYDKIVYSTKFTM